MRVYRPILVALTLLVAILISTTLIGSWTEPQAQSQLNLYQSDLLLNTSEWEVLAQAKDKPSLRASFLGEEPMKDALKNYETVRDSAQTDLNKLKQAPALAPTGSTSREGSDAKNIDVDPGAQPVQRPLRQARGQLIDDLNVRLGLLYVQTGQREKAITAWSQTVQKPQSDNDAQKQQTAQALLGLWSEPPEILPKAEAILGQNLTGWFRFEALSKLYQVQQRQDALVDLNLAQQKIAQSSFFRLLSVGVMPVLGSIAGIVILLIWGIRTVRSQRGVGLKDGESQRDVLTDRGLAMLPTAIDGKTEATNITSIDTALQRSVLWPKETVWQVMVLWFSTFFGVSYLFVPLTVALLRLKPSMLDGRLQAYLALYSYVCLMIAGFSILQLSLQRYVPNVLRWLSIRVKDNWLAWGLGGYLVALPMVLIVSLLNQQLLKEQGGGNPILEIILKTHDGFTIGLLWFLVAVCAPVFEETLFRGFFLTSLTRYIPTWQAIGLSGVVFAIAHLNLGDLLPLSLLGAVLGVVYLQSRNLLSSILLHSLWNSGSFISLLILGSGT
jgi:uncharacterized protein